ncbi:COG3014 family protein [Ferruginibacter yonginensis]|uniref:COG3014 family protein n=1 Tax=Ferruginibacter yonginensis TaxID=1310416 RepID=A0ABV8QQU5_9BACT
MFTSLKRAWAVALLVPVLLSCASYNKMMGTYYTQLQQHDYDKAQKTIEHNKIIKRNRNALLYNIELGNLYRLKNDYANSNRYFNRADAMYENNQKSLADVAVANLLNPMQQSYRGEDYEPYLLHFYKALNYFALNQPEEALVEARRISLTNNAQNNKYNNKDKRYVNDAFALNVQGMIYEAAGDINNAFIAYRNAADVYLNAANEYYGVTLPTQLQQDVLRTANLMGFNEQVDKYGKSFTAQTTLTDTNNIGELVLFIEEGIAPIKEEQDFILTATNDGLGSFNYVNGYGINSNFNFNYSNYGISETKLSSLRVFRLALPNYVVQYQQPQNISVGVNNVSYQPQLAQNINALAVNILKERFLNEMANALARQLTKKVVEKGTQLAAESIAKAADKKEDNKNADEAEKAKRQKEKEEKAKQVGQVAGLVMNLINTASEKADTRNWQSLPAFISYVRVPLQAGENNISIQHNGQTIPLKVVGKKGLQLQSIRL